MVSKFIFENNVSEQLAADVSAASFEITVTNGANFPNPDGSYDEGFAVLLKGDSGKEIAYCTARVGNVLTVTRGQEGTVALPFSAGDSVTLPLTKGILEYLRDG